MSDKRQMNVFVHWFGGSSDHLDLCNNYSIERDATGRTTTVNLHNELEMTNDDGQSSTSLRVAREDCLALAQAFLTAYADESIW